MKTRVKIKHDCFEGTYYQVQKRVLLFFWVDLSGWIIDFDKALELQKMIQDRADKGLIK